MYDSIRRIRGESTMNIEQLEYNIKVAEMRSISTAAHQPIHQGGNGHGCRHNLLGSGDVKLRISIKTLITYK